MIYARLILMIGILVGIPLLVLPFYPAEIKYAPAFIIPMVSSCALSFLIKFVVRMFSKPKTDTEWQSAPEWQSPMQKGSLPVLFAWIYGFLTGALPFVIGGFFNMTQAVFESVSGWTTTGLTISDVAHMPHIFLLHRSFMQYCGGLGFILMIIIFVQSKHAAFYFNAEGHPDRIMPNLKQTARIIFLVYNSVLVLGTALYCVFGMPPFDAICHAMAALSTAGFSTKVESIGYYHSLPIELITILLMLVGACNFGALVMLSHRKFRAFIRFSEVRFMLALTAIFTVLTAMPLILQTGAGVGESLRQTLFGVVSTFTTTGYSTADYIAWPQFAVGLLILLMFIGGGAGSTSGGIKLVRVYLLLRMTWVNMVKRLTPARKIAAPTYNAIRGKAPIDETLTIDTAGFIACYMFIIVIGTLILTVSANATVGDALFEFSSAMGNVGISNGITRPDASPVTLWTEIIGMTLGRLEIFIVFIGLYSCVHIIKNKLVK